MLFQWLLPGWAWPLLLFLAIGGALWIKRAYAVSEPLPSPGVRRLLVGLRVVTCLLVLLALARPLLINLRVVREPALVAVVLEDSGSMALRDQPDGPDRWTQGLRLASAVDSALSHQGDGAEMVLLRGNGRRPLRQTTLLTAMVETPRAVGTDLSALVAQARQTLLARSLRALVVLSDGHCQGQTQPAAALGLPLWMVGVGDVTGPADRFLADLRYPDRIQRGESLIVEVSVGHHESYTQEHEPDDSEQEFLGIAKHQPVTVRLLHDGEVVDTQTGPGADLTRWELSWTPEEAGLAVLEVDVSPLDNERFLANNRATLAVDVLKDRSRVLLLAPAPGWDVRFLAQAARHLPRLELSVVRPGAAGPVFADTGQDWRAPETIDEWLEAWEAVVLIGPPGALLPDGGSHLVQAVRQGMGILVIAGDPGADLLPRPWPRGMQTVLPVTIRGNQLQVGAWSIQAAPDASRHPILSGITHGASHADVLANWPPLRRLQMVAPHANTEVLLQAGSHEPLLVAGMSGEGRSLWFGGRRLWELAFWRLPRASAGVKEEPTPGRRGGDLLLQQMLLWIALGDQTTGITLLGQQLVYEEGEHLPVAVRRLDFRGEPVTGHTLAVKVARPDDTEARVHALRADPLRPGVAMGELPPLPPGRWRLTPQSTEMPPEVGPDRDIIVKPAELELTQVRQDSRNLRQIAAHHGGVALDIGRPEQIQRLLTDLTDLDLKPRHTQRQSRLEPAAGWVWLAIVVAHLAVEWLLRRRYGLL